MRAILGPTNTGKTHLAVERLLAHGTGMIGLPLRLLAREIYDRMVREKGPKACALITGEERIRPENARYFACTVEAMPLSEQVDFLAVDEIQLARDPDRGHVFTDRILHARGTHETMLLGADTMRPALRELELEVDAERRERFSQLSYAGPIKITKLPKRSAIVAFSSEEVYAIAELLKRQRGGCAVIMGALSPRTRNAQVALFQSGEVDYIVATDAIGMGLNLDVGHIAFASLRKFDGRQRRMLRADELAQIAGRAGRFRDDGTFGETADCEIIDEETVERIVEHRFEPVEELNWRNSALDYASLDALQASLKIPPRRAILRRAPEALDEIVLSALARDPNIADAARDAAHVRRLWDLCTLPDFRKAGADAHIRQIGMIAEKLIDPRARLKDEWMFAQVERLDRTEGEIDTLQQRLADIRTWTYAANRSDWVENAETWRGRTREIEDKLSDALHERLMQRFVDRRTSALLKTLNSEDDTPAAVSATGEVSINGHVVGHLHGLNFKPDVSGQTLEGRAVRNAALKSLRSVIERRLMDIIHAQDAAITLGASEAAIHFAGHAVGKLSASADWLSPTVELIGGQEADAALREQARDRLAAWMVRRVSETLQPLIHLRTLLEGRELGGLARGVVFQLTETGAALDLRDQARLSGATPDALGGEERAKLKDIGVRTGRIAAWSPGLLKPAAAQLAMTLRAIHSRLPMRAAPSAASFAMPEPWPEATLLAAGYLRLGQRAVRVDMVERLIWQLGQVRRTSEKSAFAAPPELAALIGCPLAEFPVILRAIGLKPAERNAETNAITLWRFAGPQRPREPQVAEPQVAASGPFAALADLAVARGRPAPQQQRRRRRRKPQAAQPKPAT